MVQAGAMLKKFHRQTGVVSPQVEAAVNAHADSIVSTGGTLTALDCDALEIRLFNADGVPAQRMLVAFRQLQWA